MDPVVWHAETSRAVRRQHREIAARPNARLLRIVVGQLEAGELVRVKRVVRPAPMSRDHAHGVLDAVRHAEAAQELVGDCYHLDRLGEPAQSLVLEPARTAHREIGAWRKRETEHRGRVSRKRWRTEQRVPVLENDPVSNHAAGVLHVEADTAVSGICPWPSHVAGPVEQENCGGYAHRILKSEKKRAPQGAPAKCYCQGKNEKSGRYTSRPQEKATHPKHRNLRGLGGCVAEALRSPVELLDTESGLGENLRETNRLLGVDHGKNQYFKIPPLRADDGGNWGHQRRDGAGRATTD